MKRILFFPLLCSLLLAFGGACSEQTAATSAADSLDVADSVELVLRVRQTSRLYTAEYQVHKIITQFAGGLRASLGYCGCRTIAELQRKGKFYRVTGAGMREAHPHDIKITKEAPNYRS